ncbi:MAG: hypothetical protein MJ089_07585 [Ruminococcus sp.]|nr:hypothetical protein [Ruminococcus sp.]
MKYKKDIGLFTMVLTFVLIGSFAISILTVKNEIREKYGFNSDIISYIETNDKNSYVVINTSNSFYLNYYEPLKSTYIPDNVILATGWYIGSSYTNNLMYENNIENIYKDIIDKKDKFLIVTEQRNIGYISEYINSHYSEANQEIEFKLIDNQAGYKIYHLESVIK